jgi:hypothetical protein
VSEKWYATVLGGYGPRARRRAGRGGARAGRLAPGARQRVGHAGGGGADCGGGRGVGLYKLNPTHSSKAHDFNPCAYQVKRKPGFKPLLSKFNLYRYIEGRRRAPRRRDGSDGSGGGQEEGVSTRVICEGVFTRGGFTRRATAADTAATAATAAAGVRDRGLLRAGGPE